MFHIGDRVVAKANSPYNITANGWRGYVTRVNGGDIWVSESKRGHT